MKLTPRLTFIFILYAVALLAGVSVLGFSSGRAALHAATVSELSATAIEKHEALNEWLEHKRLEITALSADPTVIEQTAALIDAPPGSTQASTALDKLIEELRPRIQSAQFLAIMIIDPQTGEVLAATDPGEQGQFKADRSFFIHGQSRPFVQNIYYSPELQGPSMMASSPLRTSDGKLLAVLAAQLDLEDINAIVNRRSGLRKTDDAFLVNTENLIVTQPYLVPDPAVLQMELHTVAVTRCLTRTSGTVEADDYRGVPAVIAYRWMPETELCLIVKMDQAEAYGTTRTFGATVFAISFLALLIAAGTAVTLSHSLTRPILALQAGVARFGRGELDTKLPETSRDELGALAHQFNQMAVALANKEARLQEQAQLLEQKVQERTRELQDSYAQLARSEEIGNLGSWAWLIPENQVTWSTGLYKLFGLTPGELPATLEANMERVHPDDLEFVANTLNSALAAGGPFELESRFLRKDGQVRYGYTRGEVLLSPAGEPIRVMGLAMDITERKQAEAALRQSEETYSTLFDKSPFVLSLTRMPENVLVDVNGAFIKLFGFTREEVIGKTSVDLGIADPESRAQIGAELQTHGLVHDFEVTRVTKTGERRFLSLNLDWVYISGEKHILTTIRDITERKQAEVEIASLSRFPTENPNPILRVEKDGRITYANAASQELLEVWGCEINGYLPQELRDFITIAVDDNLNKTVDAVCNDKVYSILIVPILEGGYVNIYGRDITERKRAEESLQRLAEDLRRSNGELEQFAYIASHDLQEPLRMISSYVQLLARRYRGKLDSDADEFIDFAVDGAKRMQNLINDLLAYSRVGTRSNPLVPVSAEDLLKEAVANLQFLIEESGAKITHDPLPSVNADFTQLITVFQNLVANAIKFRSAEPPCIHIDARQQEEEWIFSVSDNGIGIDPKFAERIFIIFQRLNERTAYPGTGIGLAICKRVVQRHGGRIWVESKLGEGATFYFTLPVKEIL